jgi:phage tail sheath gpL-like
MGIGDTGISTSWKVPGFVASLNYAQGPGSGGGGRLPCLLVGMKTSAGSMVADQDIVRVTSEAEIDAYAGPGSQLARMAYKAFKIPSVELWLSAVTEPGAGTAGTITIVLTGTVGNGTVRTRLAGESINVSTASTMSLDDFGAAYVAAFNSKTKLPATAAYNVATDTITLTLKNKGATGRDWIFYFDTTDKPSTLTLTITGSSTLNTNGFRFGAAASGTGSEDITTLLTKLTTKEYSRVGVAQNDATNAALWETHVNSKAGQLSQLYDQVIFGANGTLAAAQSLAQTTLNAFNASVLWLRNSESHPCEIAALFAAVRSVREESDPNPDYDGYVMTALSPQAFPADSPDAITRDQALQNGVTPLFTENSTVKVDRAITSYCLNGAVQDERCLDIGCPTMTQYGVKAVRSLWNNSFRPANPRAGDNPAEGAPQPLTGVATPYLWNTTIIPLMAEWYRNGWTEYPPEGEWAPIHIWDKVGKFIKGDIPIPVRPINHRVDERVLQIAT